MGFNWNAYNDARADKESRPFVSRADKDALVSSGEPFRITNVRHGETKHGKRYFVDVTLTGGKEATIPFAEPSFQRRDNLLAGMMEHFGQNGADPINAKLVQWGPAYGLEAV